jgi:hypothetical protein
MKVYNCFQFFNELDILEIRLQENWDTTDYFVISEANYTHSGIEKNYVLLDNWERFKPYADKIRRIQIDESLEEQQKFFPNETPEWIREKYQRFILEKGLHDRNNEDLIVISDLDEVPRSDMIQAIKDDDNDYDRYLLNIPQFHFRLNFMRTAPTTKYANIMVVRSRAFTNTMKEREYTFPWFTPPENSVVLDHGGWHFTWLGDNRENLVKLESICHLDANTEDLRKRYNVQWMIDNKVGRDGPTGEERFEYVIVDEYFPKCIYENKERWDNLIIPGATHRVEDLYE